MVIKSNKYKLGGLSRFLLCALAFIPVQAAHALHDNISCEVIQGGQVEKLFEFSTWYETKNEHRIKVFSFCKIKNAEKYFAVLDDSPFEPSMQEIIDIHEQIKEPKNIFHYSMVQNAWIVSVEASNAKKIARSLANIESDLLNLKKDDFCVLDSSETCLTSKAVGRLCFCEPELHGDVKGAKYLSELNLSLESLFLKR